MALKKGIFITFEGIEGCGKSTHSKLLFEYLEKIGYPCVMTREPGGTRLGEEVRKILLNSKNINISDMTELFLFEACRAEIVKEIITPALDKKNIVICDRFSDATVCYQGYGGKVDPKVIRTLDRIATKGLVPDMTLVLDIDTREGLRRASKKGFDRMESKEVAYHKRVRKGYLELAKKEPARVKIVRLRKKVAETQALAREEVDIVLRRYKRAG